MKKVISWFGGTKFMWAATAVFVVAAFLRLYKLGEFATFLGDQGRDAIVMRNIVTFHNLPALGPITSVGSIYLGPFYYYLMAPWLGLFALNPVGPAYGVAVISTVAIALQYFAVKDLTDKETALMSIIFSAFSAVLIEYARFSWNPNLLPPVAFFAVYATIKAVRTYHAIWFALVGALVSCALQLHYLAFFLLPYAGLVILYYFIKDKKVKIRTKLINTTALAVSFGVVYAPFLVFELIHKFPNLHSVYRFAHENAGSEQASKINELLDMMIKTLTYSFQIDLSKNGGTAIAVITLIVYLAVLWWNHNKRAKTDKSIMLFAIAFFGMLIGTSLYHGPKYPHYLGSLYILFYVLTAYILRIVMRNVGKVAGIVLSGAIIGCFVFLNAAHYTFIWQADGSNQIRHAKRVAEAVRDLKPQQPYSLTSSPQAYADYPYRYFLVAWNMEPITKEEDSTIDTKDLFVLCEQKCDPMKDSQWAIAHFSPKGVVAEKQVDGMYIYKLNK